MNGAKVFLVLFIFITSPKSHDNYATNKIRSVLSPFDRRETEI